MRETRGSYKIIATNPVRAWCGGVAHVDRKRRLPRIAEMHVEAGGQSDLVGKRSRCDSTDSVENLGTFAHTHTRARARRTHAYARVEHVVTAAVGVRERILGGKGGDDRERRKRMHLHWKDEKGREG